MGNKKETSDCITKSYKFKTKESQTRINELWIPLIRKYIDNYNKVSLWIANNLTNPEYTLGKVADIIKASKSKEMGYYHTFVSDEYKDKPLYYIFKDNHLCGSHYSDIFVELDKVLHISDGCQEIPYTYYGRRGYVKQVTSNYSSKFSNIKLLPKKKNVTDESSFEDKVDQYIYESTTKGKKDLTEWEDYLTYIIEQQFNQDYIDRISLLVDFYKCNQDKVNEVIETKTVEKLKDFMLKGCQRKVDNISMSIEVQLQDFYNWKYEDGRLYCLLKVNGNLETIEVCVNKLFLKDIGNVLLKRNNTLILKYEKGSLYFISSFDVPFSKFVPDVPFTNNNTVGIDINTKHALMFTSVLDNGKVKGYYNIYKHLLEDEEIVRLCKKLNIYKVYRDHAKCVTFCPVECDLVINRYMEVNNMDCDKDISMLDNAVYDRLVVLRDKESDVYVKDYITRVILVRREIRAYMSLYFTKIRLQSEYDKTFNSQKDLEEHPFHATEKGKEIIAKMANVQHDLIGNRDNIICYAYKVLQDNGYMYLGLEFLTSSQEKRKDYIPTPLSMLKKPGVGILGKTRDELANDERFVKFQDCYLTKFDNEGKIVNCFYNDNGMKKFIKSHLNNLVIKAIHFADFKGKFVQLSNYGKMQVAMSNSQYTSLMDSRTNSIYVVKYKNKDGKVVTRLAKKEELRPYQELHKECGLNADYNAACNIRNRLTDPLLYKALMSPKANTKYGNALFETKTNSIPKVVIALKKIGRTIVLKDETEEIFECKDDVNKSESISC